MNSQHVRTRREGRVVVATLDTALRLARRPRSAVAAAKRAGAR